MLVPWRALTRRHLATAQWSREAEQKIRRLAEEELQESSERDFQAYGAPLDNMTAFKYLGRVMTEGDEDWPILAGILQKMSKSWGQMSRILSR